MDAVADQFRVKMGLVQHNSQQTGFAMIERPHRIEGVGGADSTRCDASFGFGSCRIAVPQADANAKSNRCLNQRDRLRQLRRDSHQNNVPARGFPEPL